MLSLIAITMLLVSTRFVYALPLLFFPAHPHGELCSLSRSPKESTCPGTGGQSGLPGGRMGMPTMDSGPTDTAMTSFSCPCPHGRLRVGPRSVLSAAVLPSASASPSQAYRSRGPAEVS